MMLINFLCDSIRHRQRHVDILNESTEHYKDHWTLYPMLCSASSILIDFNGYFNLSFVLYLYFVVLILLQRVWKICGSSPPHHMKTNTSVMRQFHGAIQKFAPTGSDGTEISWNVS